MKINLTAEQLDLVAKETIKDLQKQVKTLEKKLKETLATIDKLQYEQRNYEAGKDRIKKLFSMFKEACIIIDQIAPTEPTENHYEY